jgi:hypothetical protein
MRLLGMSGAWPVGKGENRKMLSEKPPAFSKAATAAARKAASGGRPDQVLLAAVKPLTRTARANRKASRRQGGNSREESMSRLKICPPDLSRADYAGMYGPTTGDKVRLADTELFIEVEKRPHHLWRRGESSAAAR